MAPPRRCPCQRPRGGLDDRGEGERPWSPDTAGAPAGLPAAGRRAARDGAPTVTVRYVVVDGPDGQALAQRQAAALRQALTWLAAHPDTDNPTDDHTDTSNQHQPRKGNKET